MFNDIKFYIVIKFLLPTESNFTVGSIIRAASSDKMLRDSVASYDWYDYRIKQVVKR